MTFSLQKHPGPPALSFRAGPLSGPPLLLLHGVGRFSEDFSILAPTLMAGWHMHVLDFRGHGDSERAAGEYLVTDYVRDTVAFVQSRFAEPVVLFGHSLGAMVALAVAAERPAAVRAVILEDPPFHTMGRRIAQTPWQALFVGMRQAARDGGSIDALAGKLAEIRVPSRDGKSVITLGEVRSPQTLAFSALCLSRVDPEVFTPIIAGRWLEGYDERALFKRASCPVLLLQGDPAAGGALTDEDAEAAVALMPRCQRIQFPHTGHLLHWDKLPDVLRVMAEFTATLPPRAARLPVPSDLARTARAAQAIVNPSVKEQPEQLM